MERKLFEQELGREGYEISESGMQPGPRSQELHTHEFDARILVLDGEITITREDGPTIYKPGDSYSVPAGTRHNESVGADGAKYVVGKRTPST